MYSMPSTVRLILEMDADFFEEKEAKWGVDYCPAPVFFEEL